MQSLNSFKKEREKKEQIESRNLYMKIYIYVNRRMANRPADLSYYILDAVLISKENLHQKYCSHEMDGWTNVCFEYQLAFQLKIVSWITNIFFNLYALGTIHNAFYSKL